MTTTTQKKQNTQSSIAFDYKWSVIKDSDVPKFLHKYVNPNLHVHRNAGINLLIDDKQQDGLILKIFYDKIIDVFETRLNYYSLVFVPQQYKKKDNKPEYKICNNRFMLLAITPSYLKDVGVTKEDTAEAQQASNSSSFRVNVPIEFTHDDLDIFYNGYNTFDYEEMIQKTLYDKIEYEKSIAIDEKPKTVVNSTLSKKKEGEQLELELEKKYDGSLPGDDLYGKFTQLEYACMLLRTPHSTKPWLNQLILESRKLDKQ